MSPINIDAKIFHQILADGIQQYIKRILNHEQVGVCSEVARLIQHLKINVVHHIKRLKKENQ